MPIQLPDTIRREVETTVRTQLGQSRIVDVYATAEEIRRRHATEEFSLEAIAASVAHLATQCGCAVEFGRSHRSGDDAPAALA
jgi:hypothetical protein